MAPPVLPHGREVPVLVEVLGGDRPPASGGRSPSSSSPTWILEVSPFIFALSTATMVVATFALTAMALGFGALFPNYETDNVAEIPTSFGGLLFMMTAVAYLAGVILLEAWPVYSFLSATLRGEPFRNILSLPLVLGIAGAVALTVVAVVWPLRAGVRKVRALDFQ